MRRDPGLADRVRAACGNSAKVYVTSTVSELSSVARDIADEQIPLVGILGGDGTCSYVLTALWQAHGSSALPKIAFLRGGTMNTVASSLGVSAYKPSELLRRTLKAAARPEALQLRTRPAMIIGDRLGFLFGTGVWSGYLAESYADGPPTRSSNAMVLARVVASAATSGETYRRILQAHALSVEFAEGHWEARNYLSIAAGTVEHAGFGFKPFHRAFQRDDGFQLLAVKTGPRQLIQDFPGMLFGRGLRAETAYNTTTAWAELRSATGGEFGYSVDGEVATARASLRLTLGPSFSFLMI
jgi:diacylglycerol kinase (ATP)